MLSFDVNNRPLHRTIKKLIERGSPELKSIEKPMENICFSMVAIKNHCKTQHFQYFGLPDLSPELEKPKKTLGILMVAIKKHCKTQCFCYFWSPRSLSRTSPKPLQNRDPKKLSLRIYIYDLEAIRQGPAGRDRDMYLLSGPLLWKRFATLSTTSIT